MSYHEAGRDVMDSMRIEYGGFDIAPERMVRVAGRENFNIKLIVYFDPSNPDRKVERCGIVSDDFLRLFFLDDANTSDVNVSERISKVRPVLGTSEIIITSQAEAEQILLAETDPVLCPPGPYTLQPSVGGRLLWISGVPGSGKSTSAQLLARLHGQWRDL